MIRKLVQRLAAWPAAFNVIRWILEGGYHGHKSVINRELSLIRGLLIDIGCGTGFYARFFSAASYFGFDISPVYIAAAIQKHPSHRFMVASGLALPVADQSFGAAMISGVLHHLSNDDAEAVLSETARVLSPDGQLVVWEDVPATAPWNIVGHVIHRFDLGRHIRYAAEYRSLIEQKFVIRSERQMRSGFMDYVVFACTPR